MQGTTLAYMRDSNFRRVLHHSSDLQRYDDRCKQPMLEI